MPPESVSCLEFVEIHGSQRIRAGIQRLYFLGIYVDKGTAAPDVIHEQHKVTRIRNNECPDPNIELYP